MTHHHTVTQGHLLEMFQVVAIMPDELVVDADGSVLGHGYDDG